MNAKKCDICGKFYHNNNDVKYNGIKFVKIRVDGCVESNSGSRPIDICNDCKRALTETVERLKDGESNE